MTLQDYKKLFKDDKVKRVFTLKNMKVQGVFVKPMIDGYLEHHDTRTKYLPFQVFLNEKDVENEIKKFEQKRKRLEHKNRLKYEKEIELNEKKKNIIKELQRNERNEKKIVNKLNVSLHLVQSVKRNMKKKKYEMLKNIILKRRKEGESFSNIISRYKTSILMNNYAIGYIYDSNEILIRQYNRRILVTTIRKIMLKTFEEFSKYLIYKHKRIK